MLNYRSLVNNESEREDLNNQAKSTETIDIISCVPKCSTDARINPWQFFGVGRHIENSASFTVHHFLVQSRCLNSVCWACYTASIHCYLVQTWKCRYLVLAYNMLTSSVCGVSLFLITAISVDRFLALHCHMRYQNLVTKKRTFYASATFWFISIVLPFTSFFNVRNYYLTITVGISICLLTCSFSYIKIYLMVRRHQLQIHAQQQAVRNLNIE